MALPTQGPDHREAARRDRPRAAPLDRRAGHGPLDRGARRAAGSRSSSPSPPPAARSAPTSNRRSRKQVSELEGVTEVGVGFDVLSDEEKGDPAEDARPRQAAAGRAGPGEKRDLRRLRQGRRRQVDDDRQPGRGADRRRPPGRRPRLRRLRLLDPAHARGQQQTRGQRRAQDPAAGGRGRGQGDVDRLLRRGERRGRLARADAAQGDPAVPRGRRLGRAGVPAARPAAGNRRRLDDAGPALAAGQVRRSSPRRSPRRSRWPGAAPRWR